MTIEEFPYFLKKKGTFSGSSVNHTQFPLTDLLLIHSIYFEQ